MLIKDFPVPPPTLCQSLDPQGVPSITDIPSCPLIVVEMIFRTSLELQLKVNETYMYRIARKFRGVKFLRKLIRLSFRDFFFTDSDPIAIISDVNIVSRIKIFVDRDKSAKNTKILTRETF